MQGTCGVSVEIDLSTAPAFAAAIGAQIDGAARPTVRIDCTSVTFMDSSAFHALIYATRYATGHGHRLVVSNLRPNCARLIRLCDWDHELTIASRPHLRLNRNAVTEPAQRPASP